MNLSNASKMHNEHKQRREHFIYIRCSCTWIEIDDDVYSMMAGSILSKKIAESPAVLVLDVKLGKAAIIPDEAYMRKLAQSMVRLRLF